MTNKIDYVTFQDGRFVWIGDYHSRAIPKQAGFRWNPENKSWWTDDSVKAHKLKNYADDSALAQMVDYEETIAASRATDSKVELPSPDGLDYLPYQRAGIQYALVHKNTLFGDEMGLGKTIQAIGTINADKSIKNILIVCPASLKINWNRELSKWLVRDYTVDIANGSAFPSSDIVIINYDILEKNQNAILARDWDLIVVDESHYIKNGKAKRTKALVGYWNRQRREKVAGIVDKCAKRIFLTGTPLPNKPIELWTTVNTLAPEEFRSVVGFGKRYCGGYKGEHGWDFTGSSNQSELQAKMRELFMVRRLKEDVLTDLPAKLRQVIPVESNIDLTEGKETMAEYLRISEQIRAIEAQEAADMYGSDMVDLRKRKAVLFEEMSKIRHQQAVAKIPDVIAHLEACFEEGIKKIVCFAHHRDVIEAISEAFEGSVKLYGGMASEAKDETVNTFQNDPSCKLFVGSIQAAGVGLTLTASSHVVFAELDWVPGNVTQAEDRCHRIGQEDTVLVQHLVIADSIDDMMVEKIIAKQDIIFKTMDKKLAVEDDSDLIPVKKINRPMREDGTVADRFDYEAVGLTLEQVKAMQEAVAYLASLCDGASTEDGMGFNGLDTPVGMNGNPFTKALLESDKWTAKQALAAKKMLKKYRNTQIPEELVEVIWAKELETA